MPPSASPEVDSMRVVELDTQSDPRWDAFVRAQPESLVFHLSTWLRALEREFGQRTIALACEDARGSLCGILPMMRTRGMPFGIGGPAAGPRLSSLPRTPLAGPVATTTEAYRVLLDAAMATASEAGLILQLKVDGPRLDAVDARLQGRPWRTRYVRRLPEDPDQLRFGNSRNNARIRWSVGKAQREGLRVREADSERDVRTWYRLYLEANRRHGQPSRPYRLFAAMWELLAPIGAMRLLLVERGERTAEIIAGSVVLQHNQWAFYVFNGRRRKALSLRANDLLQWHAMRDAAAAGFRYYDFGEVETVNASLAEFKAKWGTDASPLYRYYAPSAPGEEATYGSLEERGRVRSFGLALWQRVPLSITALAGDRLYRFL